MLLGRNEIVRSLRQKQIRFEPSIDESQIGICSVDLRIGCYLARWKDGKGISVIPSLANSAIFFDDMKLNEGETIHITPGDFILVHTYEKIFLPNNIAAMVEGRSTYARWGLSAHVTAPLIEPGFYGPITLEMFNHGKYAIDLIAGKDRVCQIIFHPTKSPIPKKAISNLGRYRGQTTPHPKPIDSK